MAIPVTGTIGAATISSRAIGVDVPEGLTRELSKLKEAALNLSTLAPNADLPGLVLDAWLAGRDPLTNKEIIRAATAQALRASGVGAGIDIVVEKRQATALAAHADEWVESLIPVASVAADTLAEARDAIPGFDLNDAASVGTMPADHLALWGKAREARLRLDKVLDVWQLLAGETKRAELGAEWSEVLILADLNLEQYESMRGATVDKVIGHGYPMKLATFAEHRDRMERFVEERDADREADAFARTERLARTRNRIGVSRIPVFD